MRTGITTMTLDWGQCPAWLFQRMTRLGRVIALAIISEFGSQEFIRRLADPVWFQSLGTLMAFDWNASGLTVVAMAALKEALRGLEYDADLFICGGKGKTSRKTPEQITSWSWTIGFDQKTSDRLVYTSKASAKVDSALIQDGFTLYHHNFIFNKKGQWAVVQQGMNTLIGRARRYHWLGDNVKNFIEEPHTGIATQAKLPTVLDLTNKISKKNKEVTLELVKHEKSLYRDLKILSQNSPGRSPFGHLLGVNKSRLLESAKDTSEVAQRDSSDGGGISKEHHQFKILSLPGIEFHHHPVENEFLHPQLRKTIDKVVVARPNSFESLLMTPGVGGRTIRALSLVSEVIYGAKPSYEDPARYSFSFGGKDGTPYPVDRTTYDKTLSVLENAVRKSNLFLKEKNSTLQKIEDLQKRLIA
ncbi:DUF763 domain-containing protein [Candidatus Gottesmanbacteria bacterium]|nr:DUF763 domain-containing protein [Candidatus Gottesmanbacteria bacterium]